MSYVSKLSIKSLFLTYYVFILGCGNCDDPNYARSHVSECKDYFSGSRDGGVLLEKPSFSVNHSEEVLYNCDELEPMKPHYPRNDWLNLARELDNRGCKENVIGYEETFRHSISNDIPDDELSVYSLNFIFAQIVRSRRDDNYCDGSIMNMGREFADRVEYFSSLRAIDLQMWVNCCEEGYGHLVKTGTIALLRRSDISSPLPRIRDGSYAYGFDELSDPYNEIKQLIENDDSSVNWSMNFYYDTCQNDNPHTNCENDGERTRCLITQIRD